MPTRAENDNESIFLPPQTRAVRTVWLLEEISLPYELERLTLGPSAMRGPEYTRTNPNPCFIHKPRFNSLARRDIIQVFHQHLWEVLLRLQLFQGPAWDAEAGR